MTSGKEDGKPDIIVICGPTGIGKTTSAILAAERFHGEIISADSMQIYRCMDIGTAKPTNEETERARHHMIDIVDPNMHFDAAMYCKQAREKIKDLEKQGILPIVAGGTGLYIKTLVHGIFNTDPVDPAIRAGLKQIAEKEGTHVLYERLKTCDPDAVAKIHPHDEYRIIRGLEIFESTGQPMSKRHQDHGFQDAPYRVLKIGLEMERKSLYERINQRVNQMIEQGLLHEVNRLLAAGYDPQLKSMQSIGYRHMVQYIQKKLSWEEAVETMKRDTRRFAKRQITWFAKDPGIISKHPQDWTGIEETIRVFLDHHPHNNFNVRTV